MARDESRTIRVRCVTWDQVEQFYEKKLKGDVLVVKMPVEPGLGEGVTLALGLPSGLVFALDGSVNTVGSMDTTGKWPVAMKMHGLTRDVRDRLARLVKDGRDGLLSTPVTQPVPPPPGEVAPAVSPGAVTDPPVAAAAEPGDDGLELVPPRVVPRVEDVEPGERVAYEALAALDLRLRDRPAHEVLGVAPDAELRAVRQAYFALARKHHPDAYARHRSPALRALAQEMFLHVNRAYDRLRHAALTAGGALAAGPALSTGRGWFVGPPKDGAPAGEVTLVVDDGSEVAPPAAAPPVQPARVAAVAPVAPVPVAVAAPLRAAAPAQPARMTGARAQAPVPPGVSAPESEAPRDLASELFGDLGEAAATAGSAFDTPIPNATDSALSMANAGRAALAGERFDEARTHFAAALRLDGRNRAVRALYHVASGLLLRARGQAGEAQTQLETALGHDPQCAEAQQALGRGRSGRSALSGRSE